MKTLNDLLNLIVNEIQLNEKYVIKYYFDIDTQNLRVSMKAGGKDEDNENKILIAKEVLMYHSIETPAEIQQAYWTIYNNGRTQYQEEENK